MAIATKLFGKSGSSASLSNFAFKTGPFEMVALAIILASAEEGIFRFALLGLTSSQFGMQTFWLVLSSVAFGLAHVSNVQNRMHRPFLVASHSVAGLVFGLIYLRYGFFVVSAVHCGLNIGLIVPARIYLHFRPAARAQLPE